MSEQKSTRRDKILQAACLEFSEKGFAGARIEQIARGAGIGKSTVYEYFPSKLDLLDGAAAWMIDRIADDVMTIMQSALPFADKIREYLLYMCRMLQEIGPGMIYMQGDKKATADIMRLCVKRFFEVILDAMTAAVQQAKHSDELRADASAATIAHLVCYLPSPALAHELACGNPGAVDAMVDLLMRGIASHRG